VYPTEEFTPVGHRKRWDIEDDIILYGMIYRWKKESRDCLMDIVVTNADKRYTRGSIHERQMEEMWHRINALKKEVDEYVEALSIPCYSDHTL
jgi:rhamnogalacturonyl hydrolase YesR